MKGIFLNGTRCFTSHIELQALPMPWLQSQWSLGRLSTKSGKFDVRAPTWQRQQGPERG